MKALDTIMKFIHIADYYELACNIDKIIYVSCLPSSLARDIGLITGSLIYDNGNIVKSNTSNLRFNVEYVKPFDMFPQTKHVESVVCLTRK